LNNLNIEDNEIFIENGGIHNRQDLNEDRNLNKSLTTSNLSLYLNKFENTNNSNQNLSPDRKLNINKTSKSLLTNFWNKGKK
jgi:hypothetical protein